MVKIKSLNFNYLKGPIQSAIYIEVRSSRKEIAVSASFTLGIQTRKKQHGLGKQFSIIFCS